MLCVEKPEVENAIMWSRLYETAGVGKSTDLEVDPGLLGPGAGSEGPR